MNGLQKEVARFVSRFCRIYDVLLLDSIWFDIAKTRDYMDVIQLQDFFAERKTEEKVAKHLIIQLKIGNNNYALYLMLHIKSI